MPNQRHDPAYQAAFAAYQAISQALGWIDETTAPPGTVREFCRMCREAHNETATGDVMRALAASPMMVGLVDRPGDKLPAEGKETATGDQYPDAPGKTLAKVFAAEEDAESGTV